MGYVPQMLIQQLTIEDDNGQENKMLWCDRETIQGNNIPVNVTSELPLI